MPAWAFSMLESLWLNAIIAIPLVIIVVAVCKWTPCRPSTRHFLWLLVLMLLVIPRFSHPDKVTALLSQAFPTQARSNDKDAAADPPAGSDTLHTTMDSERLAGVSPAARGSGPAQSREFDTYQPRLDRLIAPLRSTGSPLYVPGIGVVAAPATSRAITDPPRVRHDRSKNPSPETTLKPSRSRLGEQVQPEERLARAAPPRAPAGISIVRKRGHIPQATRQDSQGVEPAWAIDWPEIGLVGAASSSDADAPPLTAVERAAGAGFWPENLARFKTEWGVWAERFGNLRNALLNFPPLPVQLWIGGVIACLAVTLVRMRRFGGLLARWELAPEWINQEVQLAAAEMGLRHPPETLMASQCVSPMILCGPRPRLVLPVDLWAQLGRAGRHAVICHELAHLRRRDHWVSWLDWAVGLIYWWNPLVWWIRQRLHEEAELSCDQWVTWLLPQERRAYAVALLKAKEYVGRGKAVVPAMSMGATSQRTGKFVRRIKMVMTGNSKPRLSFFGIALALALAVGAWVAGPVWACPPKKSKTTVACCSNCQTSCQSKCASVSCKGACCSSCTKAVIAPGPTEELSTFEQYISGRGAPKAAKKSKAKAKQRRQAKPPKGARTSVWQVPAAPDAPDAPDAPTASYSGFWDDAPPDGRTEEKFERRMQRLERQFERFAKQLERTIERRARGVGPGWAPSPQPFAGAWGDSGEKVSRMYHLPDGKLKALTALMIRSDVPVLVTPHEGSIEVHGTETQQRIFRAFVDMIHPTEGASLAPGLPQEDLASDALIKRIYLESRARLMEVQTRLLEQRAQQFGQRSEQLEQRAQELQSAAEELQDAIKARALEQAANLMSEARMLETQSSAAETEAEALEEQAREYGERAEALLGFLEVLQQQAERDAEQSFWTSEGFLEGLAVGAVEMGLLSADAVPVVAETALVTVPGVEVRTEALPTPSIEPTPEP